MTQTTITLTTINIPNLLEDYVLDVLKFNRQKHTNFIIAGDKKSPQETGNFCKNLANKYEIDIEYLDVEAQEAYMKKYSTLNQFIGWNCIQRRNVAILKAYEQGADIIVMIDDDNYIAEQDYVGAHQIVGTSQNINVIDSPTGWFNICDTLKEKYDRKFYPRGYPWLERINESSFTTQSQNCKIVVNAGFWLGDPDIDAVTRLSAPIDVTEYIKKENFALNKNTFAPFNSQNTAIHRDIVPAYFLCPDIGRFDDIWSSYVIQRISSHLNHYIAFGQPLVRQLRNQHDLWVDVKLEEMGTKMSDRFCSWLRHINLTGSNYLDCGQELISSLKQIGNSQPLSYHERAYLNHFVDGHNLWFKNINAAHNSV